MTMWKPFFTALVLCGTLLMGAVFHFGWTACQAATVPSAHKKPKHAPPHQSQTDKTKATVQSTETSSDALALSEEEVDRLKVEQKELVRRRKSLEVMLAESQRLFKLKEQRIQALENLLNQERAPQKKLTH